MSRQLLVAPRSARPARTRSREPMCSAIVPRSPANEPRRVAGVALFLGSWTAAVDPELLARHAVRAIVDSSWGTSSAPAPAPASSPPQPRLAHSRTSSALVGARITARRPAPPRAMSAADAGAQGGHGFGGGNGGGEAPIEHFKVALADSAAPDALRPRLDGAVRFIRERLARGENVLVHCQQLVLARRRCVMPNAGFERTLCGWK
ncbi:phosphatases II [Phellopilus nigrolimitatus]|nr:phosphatases II [Phellopilus nigrolimitatus]